MVKKTRVRTSCQSAKSGALAQAVRDDTMFVTGYEHHTLECLGCGETGRRLVIRHAGEHWTDAAPTPQPNYGCDEAPCADAPETAVVAPTANRLTVQRGLPAEPERPSGNWERRIENVRARLDDLRKRAELANRISPVMTALPKS
jgi:hypothetical protein